MATATLVRQVSHVRNFNENREMQLLMQVMKTYEKTGSVFISELSDLTRLTNWLLKLYVAYFEEQLPVNQLEMLRRMKFDWNILVELVETSGLESEFWECNYIWLMHYIQDHGHACVPSDVEFYAVLYQWLTQQRHLYQSGNLLESHEQKLCKIKCFYRVPGTDSRIWASKHNTGWDSNMMALCRFYNTYGHFCIPFKERPTLYRWVARQAKLFKDGELASNYVAKFKSIDFDLLRKQSDRLRELEEDLDWENCIQRWKIHHAHYGFLAPKITISNETISLVRVWEEVQRHTLQKGMLADNRLKRLTRLGFGCSGGDGDEKVVEEVLVQLTLDEPTSTMSRAEAVVNRRQTRHSVWMGNYELVATIKKQTGIFPTRSDLNHQKEANWLMNQRQKYRLHTLASEYVGLLETLGFTWVGSFNSKSLGNWNQKFNLTACFKEANGRFPTRHHEEEIILWKWLTNQRQFKKEGNLSEERVKKLESIGFTWSGAFNPKSGATFSTSFDTRWTAKFEAVNAFKTTHGLFPSVSQLEYVALYKWLNQQRLAYHNQKLSQERIEKLESIGFTWVGPYNQRSVEHSKIETSHTVEEIATPSFSDSPMQLKLLFKRKFGHLPTPDEMKGAFFNQWLESLTD